jgi:6,7-dimethyl-8-ribityllumazine synthase
MNEIANKKCLDLEAIQPTKNTKNQIRVLVVSTSWNKFYVEQITNKLIKELFTGVNENVVISVVHKNVPGCWELPFAIQKFCTNNIRSTQYDVIIAVGVLIKGDTKHFEYISKSVFEGLMSLQLKLEIPIINGVLTVMKEEQIEERISLAKGWAASAIYMSQLG